MSPMVACRGNPCIATSTNQISAMPAAMKIAANDIQEQTVAPPSTDTDPGEPDADDDAGGALPPRTRHNRKNDIASDRRAGEEVCPEQSARAWSLQRRPCRRAVNLPQRLGRSRVRTRAIHGGGAHAIPAAPHPEVLATLVLRDSAGFVIRDRRHCASRILRRPSGEPRVAACGTNQDRAAAQSALHWRAAFSPLE